MNEVPRGPEGQETLPDTSKYQQILQRIEWVLAADSAEGDEQFVSERLAGLTSQSQAREIGMMTNKFHKGFIHPDSGVRRTYIVDPVHIDDEGLYRELLGTFRELKKTPGWENRTLREIVPSASQHTIGNFIWTKFHPKRVRASPSRTSGDSGWPCAWKKRPQRRTF